MVGEHDFFFRIRKEEHPATPEKGWLVKCNGKSYRISHVYGMQETAWAVRCEEESE